MLRFDKCHLVNLDRRPDRLGGFWSRFALVKWPGPLPERVRALDGHLLAKPSWYTQQPGAWGCLRTHLRLIEDAIINDHDIFIFEDDVVFADDFNDRIEPFFRNVPDDWDMIYLGGLHRSPVDHPPEPINEHVARGRAITTTYAYGLRASFLKRAYPLLHDAEQHHIDQMWARLQLKHGFNVYCPMPWLVGMDEGQSDICDRFYARPVFWNYQKEQAKNPIHLLSLLNRVRIVNGVQQQVALTAAEQRAKLTSSIGGWFTPECGAVYRREAAAKRDGVLVEVGCWRGRSLSFLADMIQNGDIQAFAVDTWGGNSDPKDPTHGRDVYKHFIGNMEMLGIADVIKIMRLPSVLAAKQFEDESVDLLHVDADHEYSHVLADLRTWWPKLKPGGTFLLHDYSPTCACPDVVRAIDDFAREMQLAVEPDADMAILRKPAMVMAVA